MVGVVKKGFWWVVGGVASDFEAEEGAAVGEAEWVGDGEGAALVRTHWPGAI